MKKTIFYVCILVLCFATLVNFVSCQQEQESEYTITFYNNKGIYFFRSSVNDGAETISIHYQDNSVYKVEKVSGKYISEPTPPTNEGYAFLGWYQNPECTDKFLFGYYEINSNINLYAKWGYIR